MNPCIILTPPEYPAAALQAVGALALVAAMLLTL
jgi:hypothetical protein